MGMIFPRTRDGANHSRTTDTEAYRFDHTSEEHARFSSNKHAFDVHTSNDPATCRLNAHVDRMMLEEVSAANSRVPLSPDVAAAGVQLTFVLRLRLWLLL
jgi:hypothetical protein